MTDPLQSITDAAAYRLTRPSVIASLAGVIEPPTAAQRRKRRSRLEELVDETTTVLAAIDAAGSSLSPVASRVGPAYPVTDRLAEELVDPFGDTLPGVITVVERDDSSDARSVLDDLAVKVVATYAPRDVLVATLNRLTEELTR